MHSTLAVKSEMEFNFLLIQASKGLFGNYFREQFFINKIKNTFDKKKKLFLFSILKNRKQCVFEEQFLVFFVIFTYFLRVFFKIIIQKYRMIKNKVINIKIIFKTYLKIGSKDFRFSNRLLFYKN